MSVLPHQESIPGADEAPPATSAAGAHVPAPPPAEPKNKKGRRKMYAMSEALEAEIAQVHRITHVPEAELRQMVWDWMQAKVTGTVLGLYEQRLQASKQAHGPATADAQ